MAKAEWLPHGGAGCARAGRPRASVAERCRGAG